MYLSHERCYCSVQWRCASKYHADACNIDDFTHTCTSIHAQVLYNNKTKMVAPPTTPAMFQRSVFVPYKNRMTTPLAGNNILVIGGSMTAHHGGWAEMVGEGLVRVSFIHFVSSNSRISVWD